MKAILFSLAAAAALGSSQGRLLAEDINQGILDDEQFPLQSSQTEPSARVNTPGANADSLLLHGDAADAARKVGRELFLPGSLPPGGILSLPWPMPASPGEQDTITTDRSSASQEPFSD
jgi:hypothetical protein